MLIDRFPAPRGARASWRRLLRCCAGLAIGLFGFSAVACADYGDSAQAKAFADELATQHGFKREDVLQVLSRAERRDSILETIARPAEKAKPWKDYRKQFVTADRVQNGVVFWREHAATLARAEREFGVPPQIVVAILGIETRYGRQMGKFRVLDALTTLGFDYPPRAPFFRKELVEFFLLTREQKLAPEDVMGSYAGAMGYGQFMPSSFRKYAIDFDGDGHIDVINDIDDAIGSVANYLKEHGWQRSAPLVVRALVKEPLPEGLLADKLDPVTPVADYRRQNVQPATPLPDALNTALFMVEGDAGNEYWLAPNNFYVITRYNRSQMYALAVVQLSEEIAASWQR